jgi:hypothetical protein
VTQPDHDDITQTTARSIRAQLDAAMAEREKAATSSRAKVAAAIIAAGTLLIGIGAVGEQTRQTREDVARVLVIVEGLGRQAATTQQRLDEGVRVDGAMRDSIRELDKRLYDARRMRPAGGGE